MFNEGNDHNERMSLVLLLKGDLCPVAFDDKAIIPVAFLIFSIYEGGLMFQTIFRKTDPRVNHLESKIQSQDYPNTMSLILNAIAFIPQERLAKLTRSPNLCSICGLHYGVLGLKGVALPCGHVFGGCKCCTSKAGPAKTDSQRGNRPVEKCLSSELECPHCGVSAIGENHFGQRDYEAVAALHAAEGMLSPDRKLELLRQLNFAAPEHMVEWEEDDDDDDWVIEHTADQYLEMSFDEILEHGM